MAKQPTLSNSNRFFSAFQRYITLTSTAQPHLHHLPLQASKRPRPLYHPCYLPRRYASTDSDPSRPPPQRPSTPIYYDLFPKTLASGPPPKGPFIIDTRALRKEFLQLQALAHPDRHTGANKSRAEGTSALINAAYSTLLSPLKRAQYLLSLRGIDVAEDETAKVDDAELLMEVLEVREAIESAEEEGELEGLKAVNQERIRESEGVLERCFGEDDIESAKREAVRLRYWENVRESLEGWEKGKPVVLVH